MDTKNGCYPDVYVMSKLPNLVEQLRMELPLGAKLINVEISDKRIKWDKGVNIEPEEIKALEKAEIVVIDSMYLAKLLYDLPNVKWAQSTWTGVEMIFEELDETKPKPSYTLTRYVDEYFEELMGNYVIAQIVNIERGLYLYHEKQRLCQWARPFFPDFRVISDLTIGILGAGKLGFAVAKQLKNAGAHVLSLVKRHRSDLSHNIIFTTDLNLILETCDYICNVLPSTSETKGLLDGDILKICKKKPVLINIGRGDVISEDTITKALKEKWISKAVLDVFEHEPLPAFSPLWKTPNVIITPHVGAIPRMSGSAKFIAENYRRYISGKELLNVIDWNKGY